MIEIKNLNKSFGSTKVLQDINLKLEEWIGNTIAGRYGLYETLIILVGLVTINVLSYFVIINSDIKKRTV